MKVVLSLCYLQREVNLERGFTLKGTSMRVSACGLTSCHDLTQSQDAQPEAQLNPKKKVFETIQPVNCDTVHHQERADPLTGLHDVGQQRCSMDRPRDQICSPYPDERRDLQGQILHRRQPIMRCHLAVYACRYTKCVHFGMILCSTRHLEHRYRILVARSRPSSRWCP